MSEICFKIFQEKDHCVWSRVEIKEKQVEKNVDSYRG